ncbi:MAG: hypothetical protein JXR77_16805 [Lentisphaeria bacterium]|nr:hypothetical protein [Lentisphaeria bacterium]
MTHRERCLAVIEGRPVDRIPAYTPTIACDVAGAILGHDVHTGSPTLWYAFAKAAMRGRNAAADFDLAVTEALIDLNRALGIEVIRYGYRNNRVPTRQLDAYTFLYGDPEGIYQVWRWDPTVQNFSRTANTAPPAQPEDWPAKARAAVAGLDRARENAKAGVGVWEADLQQRLGDEMLVVGSGGGFSIGLEEGALMACVLEPGAVADLLDCQLELNLLRADALIERGITVCLGGGDMADKNGPMYSPALFHELMVPRLAAFAAHCRRIGLHYVWRTDGNVWPIADMVFAEAGVPGYGEVDYDAGMTSRTLRERYPDLVIWGNISSSVLHRAGRAGVYRHCMECLEGSGGTRYFHGCSNAVLPGSPPENVLAMMQARDDYGARS